MVDPAAMHLVIANAAMYRKALRPSQEGDLIELSHNPATLTSINQRIRDSNWNVTDEMLGAILEACKNIFE
jgi:hypothetical protein